MPELPEVETVRRGLQPAMEGARIDRVELRRPDLRFPFPEGLAARLKGRTVTALARRAKYLLMHLDDGGVLIAHLGMSGSFRIEWQDAASAPGSFHHERSKNALHDHVVLHLTQARAGSPNVDVIYNDPRRFGFMLLAEEADLHQHPLLRSLGVEPTGNALDGFLLAQMFKGKRMPLKTALLDQRLIAGLGNIYVCEALWRAGLSPMRMAGTITGPDGEATDFSDRLARSVRAVIADAIEAGGSSLRDHRQADGSLGYFQHSFKVYGREGHACATPGCSGTVQRIVQAGRSTFFCAKCQH